MTESPAGPGVPGSFQFDFAAPASAAASHSRRGVRALQLGGLTLAALSLGGLAVLNSSGNASAAGAGGVPQFTLLVAGRDIVYCAVRTPCADQDQRTGLLQPPNTDTLMLVKVDGSAVNVLNIPRDTNVGPFNPELRWAEQKVNGRYWAGGPAALVQAVETITGESIDAHVIVRTDYVARVIDALGGLDVTVPEGGIEWVDRAAGVDLRLPPGPHHLTGEQAVLYLRVRKGVGDDYGRIDHQKQALTQLASRLTSAQGLTALPTILGGVGNGVETDADPALLTTLLPELPELRLRFATLPTTPIPGTSNLAVNPEALARVWGSGGEAAAGPAAATPGDLADVTVRIRDASGADLASRLAAALRTLGYARVSAQTVPASREASQVVTGPDVAAASQLADALGLPRLQGERFPVAAGEVGILLGADARQSLAALSALPPSPDPSPPPTETP
ncbi:LCP family protein required for cell wall assembly [Deinococcus sp. HSC-46F16]|uniref:LCP family protein n=1 Tax=Deinococcus sp. HSC-46F16 TaxID=2910968 RepID=UPI00209E96E0|nr:LCP family protein [Deinococcus sp. HSC-46F16]MCP2015108.1 LCP family protein required for cell wall assembly [Deinococcus sp. HSC-46F16]